MMLTNAQDILTSMIPNRILFAVSSMGLGHATRSLPIICHYLKKSWKVSVLAHGNTLRFLKLELVGYDVTFIEREDYPQLERGSGVAFFYYLFIDLLRTACLIRGERKYIRQCSEQYDCIISDGRYGICSKIIPSFLISHQISFVMPKGLGVFRPFVDWGNYSFFRQFDTILIPDFPVYEKSLSGYLAHNKMTNYFDHEYVGLLSSYVAEDVHNDTSIDYLFVISGYLEEQKKSFKDELFKCAQKLSGHKVFILGDTSVKEVVRMEKENITIYPVAVGGLRNTLFNQAKLVISRSGYTTILDLAEIDKPALLFATPRQTEQEYLAEFLKEHGYFTTSLEQKGFDLQSLLKNVKNTHYRAPWKTNKSLEIIENCLAEYLYQCRFSFVVSIHNEEGCLQETLEHLAQLDYPEDLYEILMVENGSDDEISEICDRFSAEYPDMFFCAESKSVSGTEAEKRAMPSDWIIFLDAGTLMNNTFLSELNRYLGKQQRMNLVLGTTSVLPAGSVSLWEKFWCKLSDEGHRFTRTACALQIVRRQVASRIQYDKWLNRSDSLQEIKKARKHGEFFFFRTNTVSTFSRHFEKRGSVKQMLVYFYRALLR